VNAILRTQNLETGYTYGPHVQKTSLGLSLNLKAGCVTCLMGPNGSGKSTLLRTLAGLQKKISGDIWLENKKLNEYSIRDRAKKLSLVLTDILELGNMSVFSLVAMGRFPHTGLLGKMTGKDKSVILDSLKQVNASHLVDKKFMEISDGEKQKVQIARALAQQSKILILDEPTVYLDLAGRVEIVGLLKNLSWKNKITVLMSTHELDLAFKISDEVWMMNHEGSIISGVPEDLILQGTVQSTFQNKHFDFDMDTGDIKLKRDYCEDVSFEGEGPEAFWTKRALERIGFRVNPHSPCQKSIRVKKGQVKRFGNGKKMLIMQNSRVLQG